MIEDETAEDKVWISVHPHPSILFGSEMSPAGLKRCGQFAVGDCAGSPVVLQEVAVVDAAEFGNALLKITREELDKVSPPAPRTPRAAADADGYDGGDEGPRDCRTLKVRFDEGGERWRTIGESHAGSKEEIFDDWPMEGVRSSLFVLRQLRRCNRTWMLGHQEWVRESGIRSTDRAVHEHGVLSKALELGTCYDQLNMANIAMVEVLVKRRMLIEAAYKRNPEAPNFDGAEHLLGFTVDDSGEMLDPEAIKLQATKMKDENNIAREQRLRREERDAPRAQGGGRGRGG